MKTFCDALHSGIPKEMHWRQKDGEWGQDFLFLIPRTSLWLARFFFSTNHLHDSLEMGKTKARLPPGLNFALWNLSKRNNHRWVCQGSKPYQALSHTCLTNCLWNQIYCVRNKSIFHQLGTYLSISTMRTAKAYWNVLSALWPSGVHLRTWWKQLWFVFCDTLLLRPF